MREILFRGKQIKDKAWGLSRCPDGVMHSGTVIEDFIPETVGQYIGLKDEHGKKIFEGDVLLFPAFTIDNETFPPCYGLVIWGDGGWEYREKGVGGANVLDTDTAENATVAGNIWDNKELMEVTDNE